MPIISACLEVHVHYPQKTESRCNQGQQPSGEEDEGGDIQADVCWVVLVDYGDNPAGDSDY
jgi:hypothetical protein